MEKPYWKKVKCIRAKTPYYTVGKVYDVTDEGYVVNNEGDLRLTKLDYTSTFSSEDYSSNSDFEEYIKKEEQFQFGKWYEAKNKKGLYIKPLNIDSDGDVTSNVIWSNGDYREIYSAIHELKYWNLLTDLSEIQQFLPDGHPDKFSIAKEESPLEICKKKYKAGMTIVSTGGNRVTLTQEDIDGICNGNGIRTKKDIYTTKGKYGLYFNNKYAEIVSEPKVSITLDDIKPGYWVKIIDDPGKRPEHWNEEGEMDYLYGTWQQVNIINKEIPLLLSIKSWGLKLSDIVEVSQYPPFITKGEVVESGTILMPLSSVSPKLKEYPAIPVDCFSKTNLLPTRKFRISKINY